MRGVIIDLDGTIIKSEIAIEKIFNKLLSKYKFLKLNPNWKDGISKGGTYLIKKAFGVSVKNKAKMLEEFRELYKKIKHENSDLYCGVLKFLKFFKKKDIKVFLCTNKPNYLVKKIIKDLKINSYFSKIWCRDELSLKKPSLKLAIYIKDYFKNLNITKFVMIGDSEVDIKLSNFFGEDCVLWIFENGYLIKKKNIDNYYLFAYDDYNFRKIKSIINN
jgi:phosphoglycolate phosphatase